MLKFQSLDILLHLGLEEYVFILATLLGAGALCCLLIVSYGFATKGVKDFLKQMFLSQVLVVSLVFCLFDFLFCVWLYGYTLYAWFVFIVLGGFYVLSYIDCLLLKIPDLLNFAVLFFSWGGLYYLDLLSQENMLASLALAGSFALIRILGSFIFGKEIMGEADIVILSSMGVVIGMFWSVYLVLFSSVVAMGYILVRGLMGFKDKQVSIREIRIPFVLFLMIGLVFVLICMRFALLEQLGV